jgi:two-component system nitrogen regulation sensor histidine kinase NtrY
LLILATCLLLTWFLSQASWFTAAGLGILIVLQVWSMIHYVNSTNYTLVRFLEALKSEDHSVYFSPSKKGKSFALIFEDFNAIIKLFKKNTIEKEAQFKHFKQILEHVNLGIISIKKEDLFAEQSENEVLFLNKAVSEILQIPRHKYWHRIAKQAPWLAKEISRLKEGGKKLVAYNTETELKRLSLEVINVRFLDTPYLLITFQDIHKELEQKEIEAWHNIMRVIAHEMMNSFTPISSLAATITSITEDSKQQLLKASALDDEEVEDINLAASTIKKRSEGLLDFVEDYRSLANLPIPKTKQINIKEYLLNIQRLMTPILDEHQILFKKGNIPSKATIKIDPKQIDQIFINLIGNSIYALEETVNPSISIGCQISESHTTLSVTDNGRGIQSEIVSQVFIPFFTTRKNGSGIGLSLSKDIMKQHDGQLLMASEPGVMTTFLLVFSNGG